MLSPAEGVPPLCKPQRVISMQPPDSLSVLILLNSSHDAFGREDRIYRRSVAAMLLFCVHPFDQLLSSLPFLQVLDSFTYSGSTLLLRLIGRSSLDSLSSVFAYIAAF